MLSPRIEVGKLVKVSGLDSADVGATLDIAERHAMLHATDRGLDFAHELIARAVYNDISPLRRQVMHRRIAELLEKDTAQDLARAADLAHHATLSGDPGLAARAMVAAGRLCLRFFANDDALSLARKGLQLAETLPDAERVCVEIDLQEILLAARPMDDWEAAARHFAALAERALDHGALAHARLGYHMASWVRWTQGQWAAAREQTLQAARAVRGGQDEAQIVGMAETAKCLALLERDMSRADAMLMEASALAQRKGFSHHAIAAGLGMLRFHENRLDESEEFFREARTLCKSAGDRVNAYQANEFLVMLDCERGRVDAATRRATEALGYATLLERATEMLLANAVLSHECAARGDRKGSARFAREVERIRAVAAAAWTQDIAARLTNKGALRTQGTPARTRRKGRSTPVSPLSARTEGGQEKRLRVQTSCPTACRYRARSGIWSDTDMTFKGVAFTAKLTPTEGSLGLDVNFYDRGLFPPVAYHSEGHQDGMGVCLYLALMKRLFGERFTFALLDDVVMSVDADHRYHFCKLLKGHFPNTQFIITTHDRPWAEQLKSAGLVTGKTSLSFHSWTVDTGPLVESNREIWEEISAALDKGKVEVAAAALRRHLEYVSRHLADQIAASLPFRADGNYELGDLLPGVLKRLRELYGKAAGAAQSWGNAEDREAAGKQKNVLSICNGATSVEQWAVNKAVHYNEWANFGKKDFLPVVVAFKELLECFRCKNCDSSLHISPRANPETLRCACNKVNFNLKQKPH